MNFRVVGSKEVLNDVELPQLRIIHLQQNENVQFPPESTISSGPDPGSEVKLTLDCGGTNFEVVRPWLTFRPGPDSEIG